MYHAEAMQEVNDPGPYYFREDGRLHTSGRRGQRPTMTRGRDQPVTIIPAEATSPTHRNSPRKLYAMLLDFVAINITLVESLVGFPEVVGQQLFEATHRRGNLDQLALGLFGNAYADTVLRSLSMAGSHLALNQQLVCLQRFMFLAELEVGGCRLGDDHDLLPMMENFNNLQRLGLGGNCLTDVGIQRLTAPLRVLGRGPRNLRSLGLAGNAGIGDKSATHYLIAFSSLKAIDLSGCSLTSVGLNTLKTKLGLMLSASDSSSTSVFLCPPVQTVGWASPLVEEWLTSGAALTQRAKSQAIARQTPGAAKAASFYGRASKRLENVQNVLPGPVPSISPILRLTARTLAQNCTTSGVERKPTADLKTRSRLAGLLDREKRPAGRHQEVRRRVAADIENTTDKELLGIYAPQNSGKQFQEGSSGHQSPDAQFRRANGSQSAEDKEGTRLIKPPPRKRIRLCVKAPRGFDTDVGLETGTPEGGLESGGRSSEDESVSTSWQASGKTVRPNASRSNRTRPEPQSYQGRLRGRSKVKSVANCGEDTSAGQPKADETKSSLWSAMQSSDWG